MKEEPHSKMCDALGAAQSYLHSMRLMAESIFKGEGKDYCAFELLIDSISIEIENAYGAFDELARVSSDQDDAQESSSRAYDELRMLDDIRALRKRLGEIIEGIDRSGL